MNERKKRQKPLKALLEKKKTLNEDIFVTVCNRRDVKD